MKTVFEVLKEKLGESVQKNLGESEKELSLLAAKDSIPKIAAFLTGVLEMRFLFLFASDERKDEGCFCLRYVFSFHHQDKFLMVETRVEANDPTFPSLTPFLPQANWQEREIQDLFGLVPKGHSDPRPLVLHEDWPKGIFPLRKVFNFSG